MQVEASAIDRAARELTEVGISVLPNIRPADIDHVYVSIGQRITLKDRSLYERNAGGGQTVMSGLRDITTKCFASVDKRVTDVLIGPHCEGSSGRILQVGFLFCERPADVGGWTVLTPTHNLENARFYRSLEFPCVRTGMTFKKVFNAQPPEENSSLRGKGVTALKIALGSVALPIVDSLRIPYVGHRRLAYFRFTSPFPCDVRARALDGKMYAAPGPDCTYYDCDLIAAYRTFVRNHSEIYIDEAAADRALERTRERVRYLPLYRSGNDYSRLFDGAKVFLARPGDLVIFDNRRHLHAATQYQGDRLMHAAWM